MSDHIIGGLVTVLTALIGVAIIAVIVSKNAQTSQVISAGASGFAQDLAAAVSPVTGGSGFGSQGFAGFPPLGSQSY